MATLNLTIFRSSRSDPEWVDYSIPGATIEIDSRGEVNVHVTAEAARTLANAFALADAQMSARARKREAAQ